MKLFISGSISIKSVNGPIINRLDTIIKKGHTILIGDADGVDKAVQTELAGKAYSGVVVYCSGKVCRNNIGKWDVKNVTVPSDATGRKFYTFKDEEMAHDADFGFLIWDGKSSGTVNNLINLISLRKTGLVYLTKSRQFITIKDKQSFNELVSKCDPEDIAKIEKKTSYKRKLESHFSPLQQKLNFEFSESNAQYKHAESAIPQDAIVRESDFQYRHTYSTKACSIIDFLRENLVRDVRKMVDCGMDYHAFDSLCSGLELLGSFFDKKDLDLSTNTLSKSRIDNALNILFPHAYKAMNIGRVITKQIQNGLIQQFRPTGDIALTSKTNSNCPRKLHLTAPFRSEDKRTIFVIEQFISDFEGAVQKLINEKDDKLKSKVNSFRLTKDFLYVKTLNIENDAIATSTRLPCKEVGSLTL